MELAHRKLETNEVGCHLCRTRFGFELNNWTEGMTEHAVPTRSWSYASVVLFSRFFFLE